MKRLTDDSREELIEWIEENDHYQLGGLAEDEVPLRKLRRIKEVILEIEAAIDECVKRLKRLERAKLGVGDTATDESIADEFYNRFHC